MSAMAFREPNQVLWRGIRPGHNGSEVNIGATLTAGTLRLYTVTSGKIFYLTDWSLCALGDVAGFGQFYVRDIGNDLVYYFGLISGAVGSSCAPALNSYFYPHEIPAGYDIMVIADGAGFTVQAHIHGWEE